MTEEKKYCKNYQHIAAKFLIMSVFVLAMAILVPFFYGWINGMAHKNLCKFAKIKSVWSCGLIVREPGILGAYLQFGITDEQAGQLGKTTPVPQVPQPK